MWSLLPRQLRRQLTVWLQLGACVCALHSIALIILFIAYRGTLYHHQLTIDPHQLPSHVSIVVMPFVKTIGNLQQLSENRKASLPPVAKKASQKSAKSVNSTHRSKAVVSGPPVSAKLEAKTYGKHDGASLVSASSLKKEQPKKTKVAEKKPEPKQTPAKNAPVQENKDTKNQLQKKEEPVVTQKTHVPLKQSTSEPVSNKTGEQESVYIGREDATVLELYEQMHDVIRTTWQPPPGLGNHIAAQIEVVLNWDGTMNQCTIIRSSGIPLFDACVKRDIKKISFPRAAWGKKWLLTLSNQAEGAI